MLNTLKEQIDRIKGSGATYVDARWYPLERHQTLLMRNGNLKSNTFSRESGIGVRVLYNGAWGFAASSQRSHLDQLFDRALDNAKTAAQRVVFPVRLADKEITSAGFRSPCRINPFDVSPGGGAHQEYRESIKGNHHRQFAFRRSSHEKRGWYGAAV
jgi:TldD protein